MATVKEIEAVIDECEKRPAFEMTLNGRTFKIHYDGRVEGIDHERDVCLISNRLNHLTRRLIAMIPRD